MNKFTRLTRVLLSAMLLALISACAFAQPKLLDAYYKYDVPFPDFHEYWQDISERETALDLRLWEKDLAGTAHAYFINTTDKPLEVSDVLLAGISLKDAVAFSDQKLKREAYPASIFFSNLSASDRDKLIKAGEPIWWRVEPRIAEPGEVFEVSVRFRTNPPGGSVELGLNIKGDKLMAVDISMKRQPRIESISFSSAFDKLCAFYTTESGAPEKIIINGRDVTAQSSISYDSGNNIAPVIVKMNEPLKAGTICCIQMVYPNGAKTAEAVRVWSKEPAYGIWGGKPFENGTAADVKSYFDEIAAHNINTQMEQIGVDCIIKFLSTQEGRDYISSVGIRRTINEYGKQGMMNPYFYFLTDEPDAADFYVEGVPPGSLSGCFTQGLINKAQDIAERDPANPTAVNVDATFKPHSCYIYGQIADICMTDPYYQARLNQVYGWAPARIPLYINALYIYGTAVLTRSACAPRPLDMVLYSVSGHDRKGETKFRYPTPEEKRIEVYYSLAGGAKEISYWWYTPVPLGVHGSNGVGSDEPGAKALWKEIGLLGAEFRLVSSLIADSTPVECPVESSENLWVRSLASGNDTMIILCVNNNYACDRVGTVFKPVENAEAKITLPEWINAKDVFNVSYKGIEEVKWDKSERKVNLGLGKVDLTRMIVITSDSGLRSRLEKLYDEKFSANVKNLTQ